MTKLIEIKQENFTAAFHQQGQLAWMKLNDIMLNQVIQNPLENRLSQIYVREYQKNNIVAYPLLSEEAEVAFSETGVSYRGEVGPFSFNVQMQFHPQGWFYDVKVDGEAEFDLIYLQDLGLAEQAAVRTNEAYMSQYIDYHVTEDEAGFTIQARQNQPQNDQFPAIQMGASTKIIGYATDGFDIYGTNYKLTNQLAALTELDLPNRVYQYEFAQITLQTEKFQSNGATTFYGYVTENQPVASGAKHENIMKLQAPQAETDYRTVNKITRKKNIEKPITGEPVSEDWLQAKFPDRIQEEKQDDIILSFFTPNYAHVVTLEKEGQLERPHGSILLDKVNLLNPETTLSATTYMYGAFLSQLVAGNTNMNKWNSHARNPLNALQTSGVRIYLEQDSKLRLLGVPSVWETGTNYSTWYYQLADDLITVQTTLTTASKEAYVTIKSEQGRAYKLVLTNQVTMGTNEYDTTVKKAIEDNVVTYYPADDSPILATYPALRFRVDGSYETVTDESYFAEEFVGTAGLDVFVFEAANHAIFHVQAKFTEEFAEIQPDLEVAIKEIRANYDELTAQFHLNHPSMTAEKLNLTVYWYAHQMLVHYASPHGLEQYSGAAWGTRDVSQGPFEFFLATGNKAVLRKLILTIYSHQYRDTGDWPQWFMFDKYTSIQQEESHGDVIVWPLKIIGDYLEMTGDTGILEEKIPFVDRTSKNFTNETSTLMEHIELTVKTIESRFMKGTALSNYGDGDWDDTLQPANAQLKKNMVSSWTVALTYQAFKRLAEYLPTGDKFATLATRVQTDFEQYMIGKTDVIPGFLYLEEGKAPVWMIHPEDKDTNIKYRLIPLTRSVIAELVSKEQAQRNFDIIDTHLLHPDGVRLMSEPAHYAGGVSTHFKRAEQAANFGREVGLQYVHAHIRYIESLAKIGDTNAWHMLEVINPINIKEVVPNAMLRQSNTYFSSSDAAFSDRYQAQNEFSRVKEGSIPVKGGWRIYSSGPGIYLHQLISSVLGIRQTEDTFIFDPILPDELDGLECHIELDNYPLDITFELSDDAGILVDGEKQSLENESNPYRTGAIILPKKSLTSKCSQITIKFQKNNRL
ncbi:GH36-type glycosyl hydrolase domain-containing protein [Listeria seeligeri]|uniref:GH36-type glycosyl hydrolase domain-containing protein n=1 Tax=Listeria seeligeri TaxID=1640 RepID=UPI0010CE36D7|nr:amylo-alpha-1,6-glucosidase [Listeria seeligeri]MBC1810497.1 cellobiose phosphorylase [Listeria seeligeri]MBC1880870.1 cellobiose phosphorylase [Listeria seeligeri]MBC1996082.1 cellobiose phosphorylase [Listeria seeligeri]MBC2227016.1 cellobiose phosphorylase [Listeria seeligeri]MBT0176925.1 cellobiose phosphorylase [Listeria seeligeri]